MTFKEKFLADLLELAEEQDLDVYSVIADVVNGQYNAPRTESNDEVRQSAFELLNQAS